MKQKFLTESGTWYEVTWSDESKSGTWARLSSTEKSGVTRRDSGDLVSKPYVAIGERAAMEDGDILKDHAAHFVVTSPVVLIEGF